MTVQFIIEGYEHMATVSTIDARKAIIRISIMPDYIADVESLMEHLQCRYDMKEIFDYQEK